MALLQPARIRYRGRARADQEGGLVLAAVTADGAVTVHTLDSGVRPQVYNPAGSAVVRHGGRRVYIRSESENGEVLVVTGEPLLLERLDSSDGQDRPPRTRVKGTERNLVEWMRDNPDILGLKRSPSGEEVGNVGGRVDLQFGETVVEVKMHADVRTSDQALRYPRDPSVARVVIACLDASEPLMDLCSDHERIALVLLDDDDFDASLKDREV